MPVVRSVSHRALSSRHRVATVVLFLALLFVGTAPVAAQSGTSATLQCGCPLEWSGPWEGVATFDDDLSLDSVALVAGDAVLIVHEIPLESGSLDDLLQDRSDDLLDNRTLDDVEILWNDVDDESGSSGRTWVGPGGEELVSYQWVQVWEFNYLISIELVAPLDDFEDAWSDTEDVLLVNQPILHESDVDDVFELLAES